MDNKTDVVENETDMATRHETGVDREETDVPDSNETLTYNKNETLTNSSRTLRKKSAPKRLICCDYIVEVSKQNSLSTKEKVLKVAEKETTDDIPKISVQTTPCPDNENPYHQFTIVKQEHADDTRLTKNIMCDICGKTFVQKSVFEAHLRVHTGERPYKCKDCGKAFKQKSGLVYHEKTHWKDGNKLFFCEECGSGFSSKHALEIHTRKHLGQRDYLCEFCDKQYADPNSLRRHRKSHTGADVACLEPACKRKFTSKSEMKAHLHVHTGIKPFSCDTCSKTFTTKAKMQEHSLLHTTIRPFECPICHRAFSQKSNMLTHVNSVHQIDPRHVKVEKCEGGKYKCSMQETFNASRLSKKHSHAMSRFGKGVKKTRKEEVESSQFLDNNREQCKNPSNESEIPSSSVDKIPKNTTESKKSIKFEIAHSIPIASTGDIIQAVIFHETHNATNTVSHETSCILSEDMKEEQDVESMLETIDQTELPVVYFDSDVAQTVEIHGP